MMDPSTLTAYRNAVEERILRPLPPGAAALFHEINGNEVSETHALSDAVEVTRLVERSRLRLMVDCELSDGSRYAVAFVIRPRYSDVHPTALFSASVWLRDCLSNEWPGLRTFRVETEEGIYIAGVDPRLSAMTRTGAAVVFSRLTRAASEVLEGSGLDPLQFWIGHSPAFPLPTEREALSHAA